MRLRGVLALFTALTMMPQFATADQAAVVDYLNALSSFSANFEQERLDEDGERLELSNGDCQIKRPGRFRWNYVAPYEQLIVSDGKQLSIYDADLAQVTQNNIGEFPAGSPAALLGEDTDVATNYDMQALADRGDGQQWYALSPKSDAGDFEQIELGFADGEVRAMRLADKLGQITALRFSDIQRDIVLDDQHFVFEPPAGVDVVRAQPVTP